MLVPVGSIYGPLLIRDITKSKAHEEQTQTPLLYFFTLFIHAFILFYLDVFFLVTRVL